MPLTLMQRTRKLIDAGSTVEEVAIDLMVSAEWVRMLMSADSFRLVKESCDETQGAYGQKYGEAGGSQT